MVRPDRSSRVARLVAACGAAVLAACALLGAGRPDSGPAGSIPPWFPSGPPSPAFLATLPSDVHVDNFGNAWVTRGSGSPHVLVLAHRDAPGWIVSEITPDGYLRLQRLGTGASPLIDQFLVGKRLVVYTNRGPLPAVCTAPSTHFRRGANVPVPEATVDDLWIDVGAETADEARGMGIALLDPVVPAADSRADFAETDGVGAACTVVADLAHAYGPPLGCSITYAWAADGSEGGRGTRRLLDTLSPVDSAVVLESMPLAESDSTARALALSPAPIGISPADSAHGPSRRWAEDLRAAFPALVAAPLRPAAADARAVSAAGVPCVVIALGNAYAGSPASYVAPYLTGQVAALLRYRTGIAAPEATRPRMPAVDSGWSMSRGSRTAPHAEAWATIASVLAPYGVSEHELRVAEAVKAQLPRAAGLAAAVDARGNLILRLGDGPPARLFVAHMDEIGYRITAVDPDGRARVERKGGFYDWLYEGEHVNLSGLDEAQSGAAVIAPRAGYRSAPRPLVNQPLSDAVHQALTAASRFDVADVRVDGLTGVRPRGLIPGSDVTVLHEIARLGTHRFAARAIDDRFGDAALVMAARELWPERHHLPNTVWLVWSVEEETGLKGATWLADSLAHHNALPIRVHAVDTFVSSDSPLENPRIGGAKLGKGAVIRAVDTSHEAPPEAVRATLRLAQREGIPLQYGVTAGGNDGVPFAEHGSINVPLGWPLRSSHSAVEVADLRDLESLARLVKVLAEQPARDDARMP